MRVLLLGGGGREHALGWKLVQSPLLTELISAPGNPGLASLGETADVNPLDPETVADRATTDEPHARAAGIEKVWVNGQLVYQDGRASWRRHGRVLRRQEKLGG